LAEFHGANWRIPRGNDGSNGSDGAPGEVSEAMLSSAISNAINGTSNNTHDVSTLDNTPSDPPTLADYEALRAKVNEMILNGRK
jgi:hypothetical protein